MPRLFTDVPAPPAPALQHVGEIGNLWTHVAARPHTRILEIGSLFGGTLWYWSHLPAIQTLVAVDLASEWPAADGAREARSHWPDWFTPHVKEFVDIAADSQDPETIACAARLGPYDFAFVDGDHSYEGVRADWLAYSPLVRPGGTVAFHDTWPNHDRHEPGVVAWVDELRHQRPSVEWTDPDGVGICAFTV